MLCLLCTVPFLCYLCWFSSYLIYRLLSRAKVPVKSILAFWWKVIAGLIFIYHGVRVWGIHWRRHYGVIWQPVSLPVSAPILIAPRLLSGLRSLCLVHDSVLASFIRVSTLLIPPAHCAIFILQYFLCSQFLQPQGDYFESVVQASCNCNSLRWVVRLHWYFSCFVFRISTNKINGASMELAGK